MAEKKNPADATDGYTRQIVILVTEDYGKWIDAVAADEHRYKSEVLRWVLDAGRPIVERRLAAMREAAAAADETPA